MALSIEEKYDEVRQLITMGKEKGYLLYEEVNDMLPSEISSSDELDDIFAMFRTMGIVVVDSENRTREKSDGEEGEQLDLTPGALDKTNDPVRMYLREMGTVPLLTREGEVFIAKRIERGKNVALRAVTRLPMAVHDLTLMAERLAAGGMNVREAVIYNEEEITEEKTKAKIRQTVRRVGKVQEAHRHVLAYRKRFLTYTKRASRFVKAKWKLARLRLATSKTIRKIQLSEAIKRKMIERLREAVERISVAEERIRRLQPKLKQNLSEEYKKAVRKQLAEQRQLLKAIEEEFDCSIDELHRSIDRVVRARGGQPAAGGLDREEVHEPRPAVPRPDPGGEHRPDEGGRQVRVPARLQVLDLRHLVDPPGDHPRHRGPGAHDPHPGAHDRDHQQARAQPTRQLVQELGREPTPEEIAEKMELPVDKVRKVLKIAKEPISLETPIGEEEDSHLGDFIEDKNVRVIPSGGRHQPQPGRPDPKQGAQDPHPARRRSSRCASASGTRASTPWKRSARTSRDPRAHPPDRGQGAAQAPPPEPQPQAQGVPGGESDLGAPSALRVLMEFSSRRGP